MKRIYVIKHNKVTDTRITMKANSVLEVFQAINNGWMKPTFHKDSKDIEILLSHNQKEEPDFDIDVIGGKVRPDPYKTYQDRKQSKIQGARWGYEFLDGVLRAMQSESGLKNFATS